MKNRTFLFIRWEICSDILYLQDQVVVEKAVVAQLAVALALSVSLLPLALMMIVPQSLLTS